MATVRIDEKIKKEVVPILSDLGISLSEAINIFLHQVKLNNGMPFDLKLKTPTELNDVYGSYICQNGHLHDYSNLNIDKIEKEAQDNKVYNSAFEMVNDILNEE